MYTKLLTVEYLLKLSRNDLRKDISEKQISVLRSSAIKLAFVATCTNSMYTFSESNALRKNQNKCQTLALIPYSTKQAIDNAISLNEF